MKEEVTKLLYEAPAIGLLVFRNERLICVSDNESDIRLSGGDYPTWEQENI
ncbi:MAG: hypothetical protein IKW89_00140 [Bacteroidales bacterium]|nr:hypothetical protein [Bacteroidales bacterium]